MKKHYSPLLLTIAMLFGSLMSEALPKLNSFPSAAATIYLDFDGQLVQNGLWNGGNPLNCAAAGMTDLQITEVFNRVAEDYRPFNINITTDSTVYFSAPYNKRMRVIITPTSSWFTGVGGVSFTGSFKWGDDTPCFVFCDRLGPNSPKMVAECVSHESGHTVGLSHQSKYSNTCTLTATYNDGIGSGEVAWAPVMGNSYYRNMSGWNNGPTPYGCTNVQDNLSIITTQNGFGYRNDDHADDISATPTSISIGTVPVWGVISTSVDKDAFQFEVLSNSNAHIDINPFSVGINNEGADLDVRVSLYDAAKNLVRVYNPGDKMNVTIDTILNAGRYYLLVEGAGNSYASDYGSLGSYSISGVQGSLPIRSVVLSGRLQNNLHLLQWSIVSDDAIQSIQVETSSDAVHYSPIANTAGASRVFQYRATAGQWYYRLKVTSILNQVMYSNAIILKADGNNINTFSVLTPSSNSIRIQTANPYRYALMDVSGKMMINGSASAGTNLVTIDRLPAGIYLLQLYNNNQTQTERILKQ